MKSIELLALGIRLLGFYVLIMAVRTAAFFIQIGLNPHTWHLEQNLPRLLTLGGAISLLIFCFGIFLLKFPVATARWVLPKGDDADPILNGSSKDIQTSAFCILGVYIIAWETPALLTKLTIWYSQYSNSGTLLQNEYFWLTAVSIFQICIGIYLTFQANGLSSLLWKLRS